MTSTSNRQSTQKPQCKQPTSTKRTCKFVGTLRRTANERAVEYLGIFPADVDHLQVGGVEVHLDVQRLAGLPGPKVSAGHVAPPVVELSAEARPRVLRLPDLHKHRAPNYTMSKRRRAR
eukprot:scaffold663161_cov47-Prasinocladus_malaysianus.AAC.1